MEGFEDWLNSDNVIKTGDNQYKNHCDLWSSTKTLLELRVFFLMEFMEPHFKPELEHVKTYLKGEYQEDELHHKVSEATYNYLDDDWEEDFDSEEEAYLETGRGEAEAEVVAEIQKDLLERMKLTHEEYLEFVQQEVWKTITEVFEFLDA